MKKEGKYANFQMTMKYLAFAVSGVIFLEIIQQAFCLNSVPSSKLVDDFEKRRFEMIIEVILFAPLLEELIFRLPLKETKLYLISIFFSLVLIGDFNTTIGFIVCLSIGLFNIVVIIYQVVITKEAFAEYLAFISIGVFTIIHISNYSEATLFSKSYIELMMLFTPQILLSVFCTIVRLKSNIWYSILLHSFYNGILIIFTLIQT